MSKRSMNAVVVAGTGHGRRLVLAQPGPAGSKKADSAVGRYSVAPMGTTAIMVDTAERQDLGYCTANAEPGKSRDLAAGEKLTNRWSKKCWLLTDSAGIARSHISYSAGRQILSAAAGPGLSWFCVRVHNPSLAVRVSP